MFSSRRITTLSGDELRDKWSLAFDGSNDYIDCGANFESNLFNSSFSVALWLKVTDGIPSAIEYVFGTKSGEDNIWVRIETDGDIQFYYKEGSTESNLTASTYFADGPSKWVHLAFTLSDSAQAIYANGELIASGTTSLSTSGFAQDTNRNCFIGARNNAGSADGNVEGSISELVFYSTALSASQITTIYNSREPYNHAEGISLKNLVAWWRMGDGLEEGGGTTVYDMSSNTHNGTMTNMAPATDYQGDTP